VLVFNMGRSADPRLVVGASVHAKAVHIKHFSECARLYGSCAGTKLVTGVVTSVTWEVKNSRSMTGVKATWQNNSGQVDKHLMLLSVKCGAAPPMTQAPVEPASQASAPVPLGPMPQGSSAPHTSRSLSSHPDAPTQHMTPTPTRMMTAPGSVGEPIVAPVTVHDNTWSAEAVTLSIGGIVPRRSWSVRLLSGETIAEEGDAMGPGRTRHALDYFLAMLPLDQFSRMVRLTSVKLSALRQAFCSLAARNYRGRSPQVRWGPVDGHPVRVRVQVRALEYDGAQQVHPGARLWPAHKYVTRPF